MRFRSSLVRHLVSTLAAATYLGGAVVAAAQSTTGAPYGSPFDPYGQAASSAGQTQGTLNGGMVGSGGTSSRIEPVEINGSQGSGSDSSTNANNSDSSSQSSNRNTPMTSTETAIKVAPKPGEIERFVERTIGKKLPRFGADLLTQSTRDFATPATATVPSTYVLNPGDQIALGLSGSIDGTLDAQIDNNGEIFLPKVGPIKLIGVTYGNLKNVLTRAIGTQYRDFRLSVSVTKLRGIRVYVTGFANNPGAFSVNSLSTMVNAVFAAGGPSSGGSFRTIKLYRNGALVSDFDLYDLIRRGDKSKDAILQNEDVLYIPPVGPQVALTGSVNAEAIYEARAGESISALLGYAGGPSGLADTSRVILYRLDNRDKMGVVEVRREQLSSSPIAGGDIIQILSEGSLLHSLERQSVVVRIEGEVNRPGSYYLPPNSTLQQVMDLAGGITSRAFVYGTDFQRVSVRQQQQQSFQEAIQQFEVSLAAAPLTKDSAIDSATGEAQISSARAVLNRLRQAEPDGRVVLDLAPDTGSLPTALTLENNDRIYIPPRPTTVGVFGAVYRPASFLIGAGRSRKVEDYLNMAGGPIRAGDKGQIFVVRANGAVISNKRGALHAIVLPGDVIFVPVKTQSSSVWAKVQQISTILFQLGLTTAAFVALSN